MTLLSRALQGGSLRAVAAAVADAELSSSSSRLYRRKRHANRALTFGRQACRACRRRNREISGCRNRNASQRHCLIVR